MLVVSYRTTALTRLHVASALHHVCRYYNRRNEFDCPENSIFLSKVTFFSFFLDSWTCFFYHNIVMRCIRFELRMRQKETLS